MKLIVTFKLLLDLSGSPAEHGENCGFTNALPRVRRVEAAGVEDVSAVNRVERRFLSFHRGSVFAGGLGCASVSAARLRHSEIARSLGGGSRLRARMP